MTPRRTLFSVCYWTLAATALIYAVMVRVRLPPQPFVDPDFWGYLHPAISRLTGGPFQHTAGRDFLYPGFVYLVLGAFHDFRALSATQHALGVVTGALMVLTWGRLVRVLEQAAWRPVVAQGRDEGPRQSHLSVYPLSFGYDHPEKSGSASDPHPYLKTTGAAAPARWLGLLAAATYVTARSTLQMEHTVRPEAIFPFFVSLSIGLNVEFILRRWFRHEPRAAAWLGGAGVFVSVGLYLLKPSFGLGVFFANAPLLLSLGWPGMTPPRKLAMAGGGALLAVLLLMLPEALLRRTDPGSTMFLPNTLLTVHADQICDQLGEDLASGQPLPFPRPYLMALHDRMAALLTLSRQPEHHPYESLGFNPDYLLYTDYVFKGLTSAPHGEVDHLAVDTDFYYYRRAALHHPVRMLGKIGRNLAVFYRFRSLLPASLLDTDDPFRGFRVIPVGPYYATNAKLLRGKRIQKALADYPPAGPLLADSDALVASPAVIAQPAFLSVAQNVLTALYLPVLIAWLTAAGWRLTRPGGWQRWGAAVGVVLLVYSYNFGNSLTIAIVHSLDVDRYVSNQLAFTLFSSAAGLVLVALLLIPHERRKLD